MDSFVTFLLAFKLSSAYIENFNWVGEEFGQLLNFEIVNAIPFIILYSVHFNPFTSNYF